MSHKYLTILFALTPLINGCIVSEDTIVNGGTEAGIIVGMTAGTVMGGTPCEPGFGMVEPVAKPALDLPEGAEAPQQPPNDCRFNECGNR